MPTGMMHGIVFVFRRSDYFEAKPGSPARAGDVVVYGAGLGAVTPTAPTEPRPMRSPPR